MAHPLRRVRGLLPGALIIAAWMGLAFLAITPARAQTTQPADESLVGDGDVADAADTLDLTGLQARFQAIADRVSDSVVAISAIDDRPDAFPTSAQMNPEKLQQILEQSTRTVGTGFVISSDGWILTNEHVVGQAQQLWVTTSDRKVWPAVITGTDPRTDLAVLKIPAGGLSPVKFAAGDNLHRGQWTIALGNPFGLAVDGQSCMSVGVISALDRSLARLAAREDRLYSQMIETTAQINPGNSGGPLFDLSGEVIGINTAVILPQKQMNGVGFAIPITPRLLAETRELEQGRPINYGYLGVTVNEATQSQRAAACVGADIGVRVVGTEPESPAAAMLVPDDLIVGFNTHAIHDTDQFVRLVGDAAIGQSVKIDLLRGGKPQTVNLAPTLRAPVLAAVTRDSQRLRWRGALLGPLPADKPAGVLVVAADEDSPLRKQGVREGSVILSVDGKSVESLVGFLTVINTVPPDRCDVILANPPATQPAPIAAQIAR
jgi:serine protease Do